MIESRDVKIPSSRLYSRTSKWKELIESEGAE